MCVCVRACVRLCLCVCVLFPRISVCRLLNTLFAIHQGTGRQCESPSPGVAGGSPYPPKLSDAQLWAIEKVATEVAQLLPAYEAKSVNMKKDISLELQVSTSTHCVISSIFHLSNLGLIDKKYFFTFMRSSDNRQLLTQFLFT